MRSIVLALAAAVVGVICAAGGANAQSYEWNPQHTRVIFRGNLTFVPPNGNVGYFPCEVWMLFFTGNVNDGEDRLPKITEATAHGRGCEAVHFTDLPWYIGDNDSYQETISQYGWNGRLEACEAVGGSGFYYTPPQDGSPLALWNLVGLASQDS